MAVQEQTPYIEFIGNGVTTNFHLEFDVLKQDHLIVLVDKVEPNYGEWSFDSNLNDVCFSKAPKSGARIEVRRDTPLKREKSYNTFDNSFKPKPVDADFDNIWRKLQEMGVLNWMINNDVKDLNQYVDSLNDETKATFIKMIQDQGSSLEQLDAYVDQLYLNLAGISIENGWFAEFIADGNQNQKQINNFQLQGIESISTLRNTMPFYKGHKISLISYNLDQNEGGGEFVATQKNGLVENGGNIIASANPNLYWVRINYESITPEMCGAISAEDSTDAIERFFNICGTGIKGQSSGDKEYITNRPLTCHFNSNVNINLNNCSIKPLFPVLSGEVLHTLLLTTSDDIYDSSLTVNILNSKYDLSLIPFSVSTDEFDRRGIRALVVKNAGTIHIDGYNCKNSFYGSGLMLTDYNRAIIKNITLHDVGAKITPNHDNTGGYDAAGDAIYLGEIRGAGTTSIENADCKSYENYLGRAGVVLEQFGTDTLSHLVTIRNANFDGYHRLIHQEDKGVGFVNWIGGTAKRFSNMLFNLGGLANQIYLSATDLIIEVAPPYTYGGTSGINNFQGGGDCILTNCNIDYLVDVTERGNKFIYNSIINIRGLVDHAVSTKTHILSGCTINFYSSYLFYAATNKGFASIANTYNNLTGNNIADGIRCFNGVFTSLKDTFNNVSVFCENTLPLGVGKNKINGSVFNYTANTNSVLFFNSYQTGYEMNNCTIRALNATLGLRGDGFVGYKFYNCDLYNAKILTSNISFNQNHILDLTNCNLTYDANYNDTTPILSFGNLVGMVKGNNFYNNGPNNINLPTETTSFIYKNRGNVMIKNEVITTL